MQKLEAYRARREQVRLNKALPEPGEEAKIDIFFFERRDCND